jgi:hypothetical protein
MWKRPPPSPIEPRHVGRQGLVKHFVVNHRKSVTAWRRLSWFVKAFIWRNTYSSSTQYLLQTLTLALIAPTIDLLGYSMTHNSASDSKDKDISDISLCAVRQIFAIQTMNSLLAIGAAVQLL